MEPSWLAPPPLLVLLPRTTVAAQTLSRETEEAAERFLRSRSAWRLLAGEYLTGIRRSQRCEGAAKFLPSTFSWLVLSPLCSRSSISSCEEQPSSFHGFACDDAFFLMSWVDSLLRDFSVRDCEIVIGENRFVQIRYSVCNRGRCNWLWRGFGCCHARSACRLSGAWWFFCGDFFTINQACAWRHDPETGLLFLSFVALHSKAIRRFIHEGFIS